MTVPVAFGLTGLICVFIAAIFAIASVDASNQALSKFGWAALALAILFWFIGIWVGALT